MTNVATLLFGEKNQLHYSCFLLKMGEVHACLQPVWSEKTNDLVLNLLFDNVQCHSNKLICGKSVILQNYIIIKIYSITDI